MTMILTQELLASWPRVWELPDVWAALCAGDDPEPDAVASALLHRLSNPISPERVWEELLDRGEFAAASKLAERSSFIEAVSSEALEGLLDVLLRAQLEQERRVEVQRQQLITRARRLHADADGVGQRLIRALEFAKSRACDAEKLLSVERAALAMREGDIRQALSAEAIARSQIAPFGDEIAGEWRRAVDHAVASGEFDMAEWLIKEGPQASLVDSPLVHPRRDPWPYDDPPRRVCDWFLLDTARVPHEFPHRWAALDGDSAALEMIRALRALLDAPKALTAEIVGRFALCLEAFLDGPVLEKPSVTLDKGGTWRTFLRGLSVAELPALAPSLYPHGIPLIVVSESTPEVLANLPSGTLTLLLSLEGHVATNNGILKLDAQTLFSLVRNRTHRRMNFLRSIGAQIPYAQALPTPPCQFFGDLVRFRNDALQQLNKGDRLCFIVGPPGIGKTPLLLQAAEHARRAGAATVLLDAVAGTVDGASVGGLLERLRSALGTIHGGGRTPTLPEMEPGGPVTLSSTHQQTVILVDNAEAILDDHAVAAAFATTVQTLTRSSDGRVRCVLAGAPRLVQYRARGRGLFPPADVTIIGLGVLTFSDARRTLADRADILGLSFATSEVLDRITFYSGGHPVLLQALVQELLHRMAIKYERRREPFTLEHVESAWSSERFRKTAKLLLLGPLGSAPLLHFALAVLSEHMDSGRSLEGIPLSDFFEWLIDSGVPAHKPDIEDALEELTALLLSERNEANGNRTYRLPRSGVGYLVVSLIAEPILYIERAIAELSVQPLQD